VSSSSDLTFKLAQQQLENDAIPLLQKHAPTVTAPSASASAVAAADDVTVGLIVALTELAAVQIAREDDKGAFETLSRALKLASARFDVDDVRLVWCLGPLASACMRAGNTIEAEGLFRSSLSKLRAARPMTSVAQVALLRTSRDFATMLAHVSWNGRSREPEGRALLADENERAAARFRHGALMVGAAQAQVAAAAALVGKIFPEKKLAESSGEGTFRIARFLNMPVRQLPLWLLDKYR
jgi:hypothetical protein